MRNILYLIIGLCLLVSCSEESQQRNEALKNERIKLEQTIDSLKKQQFIVTAFNDSLFLLNKNIMENMESRERNDRLIAERKSVELDINYKTNIRNELVRQNDALNKQIANNKFAIDASKYVYIVKIKIHQTTYSLSISEHVKNSMNDVEFEIPVDKEYYDKCYNGQTVTDPGLKIGSLLRDGDFSKLKIKITGKRKVKRN